MRPSGMQGLNTFQSLLAPYLTALSGSFSFGIPAPPLVTFSLILQFPENIAPGSIESFDVAISPRIFEEALRISNWLTLIFPSMLPDTSEFLQIISPFTFPVGPITTFPFVDKLPERVPSILISPVDFISPVISVPLLIRFIAAVSVSLYFAIAVRIYEINLITDKYKNYCNEK